jgi:hypothetical protein
MLANVVACLAAQVVWCAIPKVVFNSRRDPAAPSSETPLPMPTGEAIPATGKQIRVRACDVATVEGGRLTSHRIYFDQMEFLGQLGLLPDAPS